MPAATTDTPQCCWLRPNILQSPLNHQADVVARARAMAKRGIRRRLGRQHDGPQRHAGQSGHRLKLGVKFQRQRLNAAVMRQDAGNGEAFANIRKHLGRGQQRQGAGAFAQHQQSGHMVDLRIHQQYASNAAVAHRAGGL